VTRIVFLVGAIFVVWFVLRWFLRTPPQQVVQGLKQAALWGGGLAIVALALTGRLHWLFAAGAAALPLLRRGFGLLRFLPLARGLFGRYQATRSVQPPPQGQISTVETRFLRMTLDHDSGEMDGVILEGAFEDRLLNQLTLEQLRQLREECLAGDAESLALLEAYLDRNQPDWRQGNQAEPEQGYAASGPMDPNEAREILGVEADANEQNIIQAHRRLMHKLHPDKGGSTYLAAKINQAKDCLLNL